MHRVSVIVAILLDVALLWSCASAPPERHSAASPDTRSSVPGEGLATPYWSYVRFRFARDADDKVQSFLDPLVADQVLSEVIVKYRPDIRLWRFHRRWPRDATGHQFSLLLFTDAATARAIEALVKGHPVLARLTQEGLLREVVFQTTFDRQLATEAASSDPIWPADVQREWPKYIEGASRLWLGLVQAQAQRYADQPLLQRYRNVEDALTEIWFEEANHAFFHHLSALFGYKPVRVIMREIMTF